ncbi:MAG: hypothetical protein PUG74_05055 [Prevotellaceae bacterium]|nr:hypothetical protein [Prevotellaceae bacterium]
MKKKNSTKTFIMGALLFPALLLSGCNNPGTPKCGNENLTQEDETVRVVIEGVTVDGKPATDEDLRAIGRTDVVRYTGDVDGDDLIQIQYNKVKRGLDLQLKFHAKPNIYLKDYGYRYTQKQQHTRVAMEADTYQSNEPLTPLKNPKGRVFQPVPTQDAVENVVYVTVDYESARTADYIMTMSTSISGESDHDSINESWVWNGNDGGWKKEYWSNVFELKNTGYFVEYYDVTHTFSLSSPSGKPLNVKIPVTLHLENDLVQVCNTIVSDPITLEEIESTFDVEKLKGLKGVRKDMVLTFDSNGRCSIDANSLAKAFGLQLPPPDTANRGYERIFYGPYFNNPTPFISSLTVPSSIYESHKTTITYKSGGKEKILKIYLR